MESSSDGRARPAAETYALIEPHFARLGVSRVARQTGLDRIGIPCWFADIVKVVAVLHPSVREDNAALAIVLVH